jgi:hypothetical protein
MENVDLKNETPTFGNTVLPAVTFRGLFKSWLAKFACHHKWYVHHKCDVYDEGGNSRIGFEQTLICENCGKIKKLKL